VVQASLLNKKRFVAWPEPIINLVQAAKSYEHMIAYFKNIVKLKAPSFATRLSFQSFVTINPGIAGMASWRIFKSQWLFSKTIGAFFKWRLVAFFAYQFIFIGPDNNFSFLSAFTANS